MLACIHPPSSPPGSHRPWGSCDTPVPPSAGDAVPAPRGTGLARRPRLPVGPLLVAGWAVCATLPGAAIAQGTAPGPLRIVVPFAAGGSTDAFGRLLAQRLGERLRVPAIVENRAGANGTLGAAYVARSAGDGRTLLLVQAGYASNPALFRSLPYDPVRDLAPVTLLASGPLVLMAHPSLPARSVKELIALARARPGDINIGNPGTGSLNHLAAELLATSTGLRLTSVPYKGTGGALADLLAGNIELYFMNLSLGLPYARSGKLRAVGVSSAKRSPIAPDIPALAEGGAREVDISTWFGLLAPGSTPRETIARLHQDIAQILAEPALRERLTAEGLTVVGDPPEVFAPFLARETEKAGRIIRAAGITALQ